MNEQITVLTKKEIKKLCDFNHKLALLEVEIKKEVIKLLTFSNQKIKDSNDWINNCDECSVEIFFYLADDDPYIDDGDDNILVVLENSFQRIEDISCLADGNNHNDLPNSKEYHCCM